MCRLANNFERSTLNFELFKRNLRKILQITNGGYFKSIQRPD